MNQSQALAQIQRLIDLAIDWPCPCDGLVSIVVAPQLRTVTLVVGGKEGTRQRTLMPDTGAILDREAVHTLLDDMARDVGIGQHCTCHRDPERN